MSAGIQVPHLHADVNADLHLRQLIDGLPVAAYATDGDGRITYFNKAAVSLAGRVPNIGEDRWCITAKMFRADGTPLPHDESPMAAALKGQRFEKPLECLAERPDGTRFWFTPSPCVLRDEEGRPVAGMNILLDITARKTGREGTERASRLLGAIVDSSEDAIISKDLNGILTSWNASAERLFGYTAEEVIGQSVTILMPPDRLNEEPGILARIRSGERVEHFETIRRRKDGSLIDISLTISPVRDAAGKIVGASKIARDISDRKRFEAQLIESEARFRQLANSMPQIVWTAEPDGTVDYLNQRWRQFAGAAVNGDASNIFERIIHADDAGRWREAWQQSVRSGDALDVECRFWDDTGQCWRWFMGRALAIPNEGGGVQKWFGSWTDIDEQKRSQDELQQANHDLEQFAYSASHDLQEPLRTVQLYSQILTMKHSGGLPPDALTYLGYVRSGAVRMESLVSDLLSYTQLAKFEKPAEPADAGDAARDSVEALSTVIEETRAEISIGELPRVHVHPVHLRQLFQNLIGNALKYRSPERIPKIEVRAAREGTEWIFSVSDNGIGIDPQYWEKIFGLFKRLHSNEAYPGTGIGLAICRRIVDRYHGRIWVISRVDEGSVFRFALPE